VAAPGRVVVEAVAEEEAVEEAAVAGRGKVISKQ
jgi:hypothetical protein